MLRNIYIKSFRSCTDLRVEDIDELTILVGRNGVGKSNILKAVSWCAKIATTNNSSGNYGIRPFNITVEIELDNEFYIYTVDARLREINSQTSWVLSEKLSIRSGSDCLEVFDKIGNKLKLNQIGHDLEVGDNASALFSIFNLFPNFSLNDKLRKFFGFMAGIKYYPLIETENADETYNSVFITQEQFNQWVATRNIDSSPKVILAKLLDLYLNKNDRFEELLTLLGEYGIGLISGIDVTTIDVPRSAVGDQAMTAEAANEKTKIYFLSFKPIMSGSSDGFRFDNLSFGTKRLIRFVTDFLYDGATVSLVEQPEDGVHCGLLYKLFDLLDSYSEDRQTIVASHSVDLLNRASPSDIRLVEMDSGATAVRQLSGQEQYAADQFKKNSGTLFEFLRSLQE